MAKKLIAMPRNIVSKRPYRGFTMADILPRPGSADHMKLPSRVANSLFYPGGTIVKDKEQS